MRNLANSHKKTQKKPDIILTVTAPCTLQEFLIASLKNEGRNKIKALLKFRAVAVNGKTVTKFDYPLKSQQTVTISANEQSARKAPMDIIYEDEDLIVVNKPAGLLSIATDKAELVTAYRMMMEYVREGSPNERIFIVHRLDRDTSGVLVIAKNEKMKLALQDKWAELVKTREYIAVVEGVPEKKSDRIKSYLQETKTHLIYSAESGLEAITNYTVEREGTQYSMLRIDLETGRKNQIRVHMQDMGHSIAGDKKYGAQSNPLRRLCLHASMLVITHPYSGELMTFKTPTPKGFNALIRQSL